jgi:hypothetical protein
VGSLAMNGEPAPVPQTLVGTDLDLAFDVLIDLTPEITFHSVLSADPIADSNHFFVG